MWKDKIKKFFSTNTAVVTVGCIILILMAALAVLIWEKSNRDNAQNGAVEVSNVFHWTGGAGDGKWSEAANWSTNRVPGVDAEVIFDSNSGADSTIDGDFPGEIKSLRIEGYSGKIKQDNNLAISGDYYQDNGEYNVMGDLEVDGDFMQKDKSIFIASVGDVKVMGKFEIGDGFTVEPMESAAVYLKNGDDWKRLTLNEQGRQEYFAKKDNESSLEVWTLYNASNALDSFVSQEKGWTIQSTNDSWEWHYLFTGIERDEEEIYKAQNSGISAQETKVSMDRGGGIEEWYRNDFRGIEQGFTIQEKPRGEGELVLKGEVKMKNLLLQGKTSDDLTLSSGGVVVMEYGDLLAVDARGKKLKAELSFAKVSDDTYGLKISVDDSDAEYPIIIDPISTTPIWTGRIDVATAGFGKVATLAGDVNGDGRSDFLVTAPFYTNGENTEGKAYLYYGATSGIASTPSWSYESNSAFAHFGYSATAAGDVNNDGFGDVVICADGYNSYRGRLYLFLGGPDGLSLTPDWTYTGDVAAQNLGQSVSDAGDINGDGFDDIIAGAHFYDSGVLTDAGKAFVFFGNVAGLSANPDWTLVGSGANELLGFSVSTAGDVDKDGFSDVMMGAPQYGGGATGPGRAYLYRGSATGLPSSPSQIFQIGATSSYFGNPVAAGGDINKDGWPDILIGASRYDGTQLNKGAVFAYYGSPTGFPATPSWSYYGEEILNGYLGSAWYTAGDVDGDGYDDAVAGSCGYNSFSGRAFVFLGSATGLAATPVWNKSEGLTNAYMGWYAATAGDVNGDGAADFLVSSYKYDNAVTGGRAYLFSGLNTGAAESVQEICTGGVDEDLDGLTDLADPECQAAVSEKSLITVRASTVDQDSWFDDRCNMDTNSDGLKDKKNPACVGQPEPADASLSTYLVCDSNLPSFDSGAAKNSIINPYIRDYSYTPCNRDNLHDDYYSTDATSPVFIQPAEKKFTITTSATNSMGIQSIQIEWMNATSISAGGGEWNTTASKHICSSAEAADCKICVKGGDCGVGNDVIDYASLGIPEGNKNQRFYFRVVVTDMLGNTTTTGYDNDTAHTPVLDKYYRIWICSKNCHTCVNKAPIVTLDSVEPPTDFCAGLNYTLHWTFQDVLAAGQIVPDVQDYYELQIRQQGTTTPVFSTVRDSSDTFARLFDGFLSGTIDYNKTYEWRVRAYDSSTEAGCQAVSDWTAWSPSGPGGLTFTTPSRYPTPSFTMDSVDSSTCSVCGYSRTATFTSNSTVYVAGAPTTDWYIDWDGGVQVHTTSNPSQIIYSDGTVLTHDIKLKVTDGAGHSCELTQTLNLGKGNPVWNEVAPKQD